MTSRTCDRPNLRVERLTPELWPALEDLFGPRGPCNDCWCMYWRLGAAYRQQRHANRAAFRAVVERGPPPGLLAFAGDLAVGWCQVTPRADLPVFAKSWRLKSVDAAPVWALSCLYVRIGWRRRGINAVLIQAAIEMARAAGAPALEAYPFDRALSPSATGTGFASTFEKLGFREVARRIPARPILRYDLAHAG